MSDLFSLQRPPIQEIYPQVFVLANFANTQGLRSDIATVTAASPFRKMLTPNGHYTNIPLTNCGKLGWVSDRQGYRYASVDPMTGQKWPEMPKSFLTLANAAANKVGYSVFDPDAGLINQYAIGAKLGSHQDKNEKDFQWPIVSISLGLPAIFYVFGAHRSGVKSKILLLDGDVMVWGGQSRLIFHGVAAIKADPQNPLMQYRYNITLRRAG